MLPKYFPKERWPLPKKVSIIAELQSLPPIFLLSNGDNINGVLLNKKSKKIKNRNKSRNKSRKNLKLSQNRKRSRSRNH